MKNITIHTEIRAPVRKVWECYTQPDHVMQWNNASEDWHTPSASNDLRKGGKFLYRMESRDGRSGFDFEGTYENVEHHQSIIYSMPDGRKVEVVFTPSKEITKITVTFDPELENSLEMQRAGWQSILDNFKKHVVSCTS